MDLYEFMQIVSDRTGLRLTQGDKERLVGTLRAAGFGESLTTRRDKEQALSVVTRVINKATASKVRVAEDGSAKVSVAATSKQGAELFKNIQQLNREKKCGKCKNPTETVKLANKEEANYCPTCRATLWVD